jgi:F-type H+-transporting ATPase subunit b
MEFHLETVVLSIISFGILYILLQRYAFGPLFSVMEKRRELIASQLKDAAEKKQQSEKLLEEQREAIVQARKEASEIIERARATAAKQAEEIVQAAKEESARLKQDALLEIENEKNKAIAAVRNQVSAMSVLIASKIIEKQIDEKSQSELIDQYLKEVGG